MSLDMCYEHFTYMTCLRPKYINWFSFQFIVFCAYWLTHDVVEIGTNLFFGDPYLFGLLSALDIF